ncbi:MAG: hypothetical protein V1766_09570 [Pseudomonadota bacterium]
MQSLLSLRFAFHSGLCLLDQINKRRHFVPRYLPGKTLPLRRRHIFPEMGFHGKKHLPALDRPMTGQVPCFRSAVRKIQLMPEPWAPDFQMIISMHRASLIVSSTLPISMSKNSRTVKENHDFPWRF